MGDGYVYAAKAAATTSSSNPSGWPPGWPDIGGQAGGVPWPPGWPVANGGDGFQVSVTAPSLVPVGQVFQLEATILTSPGGANTAGLLNHLMTVTCTVDGVSTQIKKTGGSYATTVEFQVTNYTGSKYGFLDAGMQADIDFNDAGAAVVFTVSVISVSPNISGTGSSTVDTYNISVDATATFAVAQPLSLTAFGRNAAGSDVSALNGYTMRVSATIGGSLVQVKKQSGDAYANSVDYTVTNYTGTKYGFTTSTFFINALASQDGSVATVTTQIVSVSPTISGTDTTTVDGCCDSWCADCSGCSGSYDSDLTLTTVPLTSGSGEVSLGLASRTVKACRNCAGNEVDATNGHFRFRVTNNTGRCIHVQFYFTTDNTVRGKYDCEATGADYSAGHQTWFYFCIASGGVASACMDHVVLTCGQTAALSNFTYDYWCVDALSPGGEGCAAACVAGPAC